MFKAENYADIFDNIADKPREFPQKAMTLLRDLELLNGYFAVSNTFKNPKDSSQSILEILFEIGKGDLSVGRIFEGHLNALLLIDDFGTAAQKVEYFNYAKQGKLFGVWNTEQPKEALKIAKKGSDIFLKGAKIFCSGALDIQYPIITANTPKGPQMVIFSTEKAAHLKKDWSLWNPSGMRASVSCRIDFSQTPILEDQYLGKPGSFYKEPYFSWGAVRFSAIQLGGAHKIMEIVFKELKYRQRTSDPFQKMRLGKMAILMETAKLWILQASKIQEDKSKFYSLEYRKNFGNMMRSVSLDICEEIISLAEKSIGLPGTMKGHPLEKRTRDLRVYLKQAGPDHALAMIGAFTADKKNASCP